MLIGFLVRVILLSIIAGSSMAETGFFPENTWVDRRTGVPDDESWAFFESWYGDQLAAMNEGPLWRNDLPVGSGLRARLLFLPTFLPASSVMVSSNDDGEMSFTFKQLDGAGGYDPGELSFEFSGPVTQAATKEADSLIGQIDPWAASTVTQVLNPERICLDGTQVVFEFRRGSDYKVISRHECELRNQDPIRLLVLAFDKISKGRMIWAHTFDAPN